LTPYGSFEVLRVKSEVTEYDSIFLDTLGVGVPINREFIEYKWIGKGHGLPLLQVTDNLLGFVVEYVDSLRTETTDIEHEFRVPENEIMIFPNPVHRQMYIKLGAEVADEVSISIFGLAGQCYLKSKMHGTSQITIDLEQLNLTSGLYTVVIKQHDQTIVKKFIYSD
jgi:hypothetical protein